MKIASFLRIFLTLFLLEKATCVHAIERTLLLHITTDKQGELARALAYASWSRDVKVCV